jgi:hypothetical protein
MWTPDGENSMGIRSAWRSFQNRAAPGGSFVEPELSLIQKATTQSSSFVLPSRACH